LHPAPAGNLAKVKGAKEAGMLNALRHDAEF
jgi:hypothetical protein